MIKLLITGILSCVLLALPAHAKRPHFEQCFHYAGKRYAIDPALLRVIAERESGLNAKAINHNRDAKGRIVSTDYGVMQINSRHIPTLKKLGVIKSQHDLLNNPCLNIQIGAWILAKHFHQCGVNWRCLGSYNAGFAPNNEKRRLAYARLIYDKYVGKQK